LDAAFRLVGTEGEASLLNYDSGIRLIGDTGVQLPMPGEPMYGRTQGALSEELGHFIDCVRTGTQPSVTMAQAARAVEVVAAVERGVGAGAPVPGPPAVACPWSDGARDRPDREIHPVARRRPDRHPNSGRRDPQ